jgi:GR25 family glycosyltransferase involved in LPS biosynthesis
MQTEERLKNIDAQRKKMNSELHIFDAVNGDHLDMNHIENQVVADSYKQDSKKRKREVGCFLSHYYLYKKIEKDGPEDGYTVILEDDFDIVCDDIDSSIQQVLEEMKDQDFDFLYLCNIANNIGTPITKNVCNMDKSKALYGTQAYIVKNRNIHRILKETNIVDRPIDHKIFDAYQSGKLNVYTVCTFLTHENGMSTTINV